MPSIGGLEMLVLLVLAIVVVGPKDLPRMLRTAGQWVAKARALAAEFRSGLDQIAREQELEELRRQVNELKSGEPLRQIGRDIEEAAAFAPYPEQFDAGAGEASGAPRAEAPSPSDPAPAAPEETVAPSTEDGAADLKRAMRP